jgi:hypothetical protein
MRYYSSLLILVDPSTYQKPFPLTLGLFPAFRCLLKTVLFVDLLCDMFTYQKAMSTHKCYKYVYNLNSGTIYFTIEAFPRSCASRCIFMLLICFSSLNRTHHDWKQSRVATLPCKPPSSKISTKLGSWSEPSSRFLFLFD